MKEKMRRNTAASLPFNRRAAPHGLAAMFARLSKVFENNVADDNG